MLHLPEHHWCKRQYSRGRRGGGGDFLDEQSRPHIFSSSSAQVSRKGKNTFKETALRKCVGYLKTCYADLGLNYSLRWLYILDVPVFLKYRYILCRRAEKFE